MEWRGESEDLPERTWLPSTGDDQSCAICDAMDVEWLHPLAPDRRAFLVDGRGYTLPTFWALCEGCAAYVAAGDRAALISRMRQPDGDGADKVTSASLTAFADADLGGRRIQSERPAVSAATGVTRRSRRRRRVASLLLGVTSGGVVFALSLLSPWYLPDGPLDGWLLPWLTIGLTACIGLLVHVRSRTLFGLGLALGASVPFVAFFGFLVWLATQIGS